MVERGKADGLYLNTTGVGLMEAGFRPAPERAVPGDAVLVSGPIGRHGMAIMADSEGLAFEAEIVSDSVCPVPLVDRLRETPGDAVHVLRDPTGGGAASALNEIVAASTVGVELDEAAIPVPVAVQAACEMLRLDPLSTANEGVLLAIVPAARADAALAALGSHPLGAGATAIGRVVGRHPRIVSLSTTIGGTRIVDMLRATNSLQSAKFRLVTSSASGFCPSCGAGFTPGARFCAGCGRALGGVPAQGAVRPSSDRVPWLIAGGAVAGMLVLLLVMVARGSDAAPRTPAGAVAASGETGMAAPDISQLSPKERFDRLYNRVMQAAQSGDQATMTRFMPMALGAYEMLDSVDADARYHAALLRVHNGDVEGSRALGDSILATQPGHLLGYVVLGTTARWAKDDAALAKAYKDFLGHYEKEMQAKRPEYGEHRASIDGFRREAEGAKGGS